MSRKSLERRLFEAWQNCRGVILYAEDVRALIFDDAIATRITNAACEEAGVEESGMDCLRRGETWKEFVERVKGGE